jgi:peptide/nickel transport system permease protein
MPAGLASYIIRRLLVIPPTLLVISLVAFALGRYAPSDYVEIQAGPRAQPETIERIKDELGLNDPVYVQYVRYLGDFVTGDLGTSAKYRLPVEDVLKPRLWITIQINVVVIALSWLIAVPIGTWAALKRGTWLDPLSIGLLLFPASIPVLVSTPILQWLLVVKLSLLPSGGWSNAEYLGVELGIFSKKAILPVLIMTLPAIAGIARYMRSQVIEVLDQDFVRTANAKGLATGVVVTRHVIRNAMLPIVTLFGFELASLTAGSIIVESLLGIPGVGQYAFESVRSRDYDGIMAVVILGSSLFVFAMLLVDVAYGFIDPRVRLGEGLKS